MIYEAEKLAADGRAGASIKVVNPATGEVYGLLTYADTETGLLRGFDLDADGKPKMTPWVENAREFCIVETPGTLDFDIVDRRDGKVLHSYRAPAKAA